MFVRDCLSLTSVAEGPPMSLAVRQREGEIR